MAAAAVKENGDINFNTWLSEKLVTLNKDIDLDVFVSYIEGILEDDLPDDEKIESLADLLGDLLTGICVDDHCREIIVKWAQHLASCDDVAIAPKDDDSFDRAIHNIIEKQNIEASVVKVVSQDQQQRKAAILANYSEFSEGDESGDEQLDALSSAAPVALPGVPTSDDLLVKNMNALLVKEREMKERDKNKAESDQKKVKDKDDREKQKQKQADRKEGEKKRTQKGEKRR